MDNLADEVQEKRKKRKEELSQDRKLALQIQQMQRLQGQFVQSIEELIKVLLKGAQATNVVNFPESFKTPDVDKVVKAVNDIDFDFPKEIKTPDVEKVVKAIEGIEHEDVDLSPIIQPLKDLQKVVQKLPSQMPSNEFPDTIKVKDIDKLEKRLKDVNTAVKKIKLDVDTSPLKNLLESILEAVGNIEIPQPEPQDTTAITEALLMVKESVDRVYSKPVPVPEMPTHGSTEDNRTFTSPKFTHRVSTDNSTTTALNANATFTGEWEDVGDCDFLEIVVSTDVSSATNGAKLLLSADGGTTTHKTLQNTITGGIGAFTFTIPLGAYNAFKIQYVNGASAQSDFDLRTICQAGSNPTAIAPLGAAIDATNSASLTRAVVASESLDGSFGNLKDRNGHLQISMENHQVDTPIKPLTSFATNQQNVGTTAVQVSATTDRKTIILKSLSANAGTIYIGESSSVTSGTGYPIDSGDGVELELDDTNSVWAIADQADQRLAWLEVV